MHDKNAFTNQKVNELEQQAQEMQQVIMHNQYIAKDFVTRFCIMTGEKLQLDTDKDYSDQLKAITEKVETAFTDIKQENYHLKNKL